MTKHIHLTFWITLCLFSIYLLTFSGKLHSLEGLTTMAVSNSLTQQGQPSINQLTWATSQTHFPFLTLGDDGYLYSRLMPGLSILNLPLLWLGYLLWGVNAIYLSLLTQIILAALSGTVLMLWLRDMGHSYFVAMLIALAYGLCTPVWAYTRLLQPYSALAFFFLVGLWTAYRATQATTHKQHWLWVGLCGLSMAFSFFISLEAILAIILIGGYLFFSVSAFNGKFRTVILYSLPLIVSIVGWNVFNSTHFDPSFTIYFPYIATVPLSLWYSLLFFLSLGKGVIVMAPWVLLGIVGLKSNKQQLDAKSYLPRHYKVLLLTLAIVYWLFYTFSYPQYFIWGQALGVLLPILPLFMPFVAQALSTIFAKQGPWLWAGVAILFILGFIINLPGALLKFEAYYPPLIRYLDFVARFSPATHWHSLSMRSGMDLIWFNPQAIDLKIGLHILLPAFTLWLMAFINSIIAFKNIHSKSVASKPMSIWLGAFLSLLLVYFTLLAASDWHLKSKQTEITQTLLNTLKPLSNPTDTLIIAIHSPDLALDGQTARDITITYMAYQSTALPTYIWFDEQRDSPLVLAEAELKSNIQQNSTQLWLFEAGITPNSGLGNTTAYFNQIAFPVEEQWLKNDDIRFESSKLSYYLLSNAAAAPRTLNVPFAGGLTLLDFAILDNPTPGDALKLRLTWQFDASTHLTAPIVAFAHLLPESDPAQVIAQQDRLLFNPQNLSQSPLQLDQIRPQGYALPLPSTMPPGRYMLIVGLYNANSLNRLPRADDSPDDFLYLTTLEIGE